MAVTLYLTQIVANARAAYDGGALQAQNGVNGQMCLYNGPCAIGVSLPAEVSVQFDALDATWFMLLAQDEIKFIVDVPHLTEEVTQTAIGDLQKAHDDWNRTATYESDLRRECEGRFVVALTTLEALIVGEAK